MSAVLAYSVGHGATPGCARKASRTAPAGTLDATLLGFCSGSGPVLGAGKDRVGAGPPGLRGSGPNSSNSSSCWTKGWAPNIGLGLLLVGMLKEPEVVWRDGGSTLMMPPSVLVPVTPPGKAPWLAGGSTGSAAEATDDSGPATRTSPRRMKCLIMDFLLWNTPSRAAFIASGLKNKILKSCD